MYCNHGQILNGFQDSGLVIISYGMSSPAYMVYQPLSWVQISLGFAVVNHLLLNGRHYRFRAMLFGVSDVRSIGMAVNGLYGSGAHDVTQLMNQ
jgi:hypothetical protein